MRLLAQYGNTVFSQAFMVKQFPLSLRAVAEHWFFTLPQHSVAEWDMRFYCTFYTPQLIHLDVRT